MNCDVIDCPKPRIAKRLCTRHWQQLHKLGEVRTKISRQSSPIIVLEDHARVALLDHYDNIVGWTLISLVDVQRVKGLRLHSDKGAYALLSPTRLYLHRFLISSSSEVDHRNRDGLDNRRENIRPATHAQNGANKVSTRVKGVRKRGNRWEAHISAKNTGRKYRHLGLYDTETEAAGAYNKAALERWGEFAVLNPIMKEPPRSY